MEKSPLLIVLFIGLELPGFAYGFPIDFSTVGTDGGSVLLSSSTFLAVGFLAVAAGFVFGCVCCRNGKGFEEFSNSNGSLSTPPAEGFVNPTSQSELTIFPPPGSTSSVENSNRSSIVRFDPLPDIKPAQPGHLRPAAFSYGDREISSQDWFYEPHANFPRSQLKYLQEYGRGWFGRIVEGEAQNITTEEPLTRVMVKLLHEDATPTDQMYFLHEVKMYRDLRHPNMLRLLGRCLETEPFLVVLEACPNGDLKTFLTQNLVSARALTEQGAILRMCHNITSGLAFMHEHRFIHTDLAARNCLVAPDLSVKIGDYGNSIEVFRSDYYCAGSVALPVRWCAPETLRCTDVTIETKEVTSPANVWTLAVVLWEVLEFCKMPYFELNDDQVIVRVLGEKNYFLAKPKMPCLHKDEMYHLLKLCWNPPLQRPTAAQIKVILENLIASGAGDLTVNPKRASVDFEERWQNLKPNNIPKTDNAVLEPTHLASMFRGSKVADSSLMESPLGIFMATKPAGSESPRFCLKSDKPEKTTDDVPLSDMKKSDSICNLSGSLDRLNNIAEELCSDVDEPKSPGYRVGEAELDSWLKGVEVRNEEDEKFVRKISEAIRDLDEALALEKTSSSEENSGESSHQSSPGKEVKPTTVDFRLGADTASFMTFTPKSLELSSLQNSEQPRSLNFAAEDLKPSDLESLSSFVPDSLIFPVLKSKNLFDTPDSLKESDSLCGGQSKASSDTEEEVWKKRIERGEFSEKVKEKSKSIADLMVLTHIDTSDDSDGDLERSLNRSSMHRRSGSNHRSSLPLTNFGSENDIRHAVLEDDFRESLKKLSNEHKEHGRFDSLGLILPVMSQRDNVLEFLRGSQPEGDLLELVRGSQTDTETQLTAETKSPDDNFLGNVASEKSDNILEGEEKVQEGASSREVDSEDLGDLADSVTESVGISSSSHGVESERKTVEEKSTIPRISISEDVQVQEVELEGERFVIPEKQAKVFRFVLKEDHASTFSLPTISVVEADETQQQQEAEEFISLPIAPQRKKLRFVVKDDSDDVLRVDVQLDSESSREQDRDSNAPQQQQNERDDRREGMGVILGACEEYTLGYYQAVTTTDHHVENTPPSDPNITQVINNLLNKDANHDSIEGWDRHLETSFSQNLSHVNFDDVTFPSLGLESPTTQHPVSLSGDFLGDSFNTTPATPEKTFIPEVVQVDTEATPSHIEKVTDVVDSETTPSHINKVTDLMGTETTLFHINKVTDLVGNGCDDADTENGKLRTPDDERSSDSGFRDKGSLSESVEDGCEGKYNLEDIEAELEDAYVKGAFSQTDKDEQSDQTENTKFEFEENKFYEDENKNEDDLSDIDGEIEFWQQKEGEDYYPEVSELSPTAAKGWYLHPPEPSSASTPEPQFDEEFMNALRNELLEKLPLQARTYEASGEDGCDAQDGAKTNINIQYNAGFPLPLSPILEEETLKFPSPMVSDEGGEARETPEEGEVNEEEGEGSPHRVRRSVTSIMESVKTIDTETFMQYLDFMVENEGQDFDDISEEIGTDKDEDTTSPALVIAKKEGAIVDDAFEEDIRNALGVVETMSRSESSLSDTEPAKSLVVLEDLETDAECKIVADTKSIDDILVVDTLTNQATLLESPKPKSYVAFLEKPRVEDRTDVFTPDSISPEREPSLSGHSRSSNESRTDGASTDITISSPDILSDYLLTPSSESPAKPAKYETQVEPIVQNNEANEIVMELKSSGMLDSRGSQHSRDSPCVLSQDSLERNELSLPHIPAANLAAHHDSFLSSERKHTSDLLFESSRILAELIRAKVCDQVEDELQHSTSLPGSPTVATQYEMSTSFVYDDRSDEEESIETKEGDKEEISHKADSGCAPGEKEAVSTYEVVVPIKPIESMCTSEKDKEFDQTEANTLDCEMKLNRECTPEKLNDRCTPEELEENCTPEKSNKLDGSYTPDWESESSEGEEGSSSSGEFIWKDGLKESKLKVTVASALDADISLYEKSESEVSGPYPAEEKDKTREEQEDLGEEEEEDDDESSTGSSASITEFVPSAWNSQATPSRSALRSPDKVSDSQKRSVCFKKQKYHCVYEYPREPSDAEDEELSPYHGTKHFAYGVTPSLDLAYDYSSCVDWDLVDGDGEGDGDLSLTDTDSDNTNKAPKQKTEYDFYSLSAFDHDFTGSGIVSEDGEFFVSSSARPFQGSSSSQFFPGGHFLAFQDKEEETNGDELWPGPGDLENNTRDFVTPDSGVDEDLTSVTSVTSATSNTTPSEKQDILQVLDTYKFNFSPKYLDESISAKKFDKKTYGEIPSPNETSTGSSGSPASPLSPTSGLGELRHARDKLKLDLPRNHNTELGIVLTSKKVNKMQGSALQVNE